MPAELDMYGDEAAFVARTDAWHRLGTVLGRSFTAQEALTHAHLSGWNVRKAQLHVMDRESAAGTVSVPNRFATVRTSPFTGLAEPLGIVGSGYQPVQNEEHVAVLDAIVDSTGAHFETAGALRGGREVFVSMRLPDHITVGGVDRLDVYLVALNSHDGTAAFRLMLTPVRVVCANTQAAALRNNRGVYSVMHTGDVRRRISEARDQLGLAFRYVEEFEAEAERMIAETLAEDAFVRAARGVLNIDDVDEPRILDRLLDLWHDSPTNGAIRGTRWAGYQAIVEYVDHYAPVRVGGSGGDEAVLNARADRSLRPGAFALKRAMFDRMAVPA